MKLLFLILVLTHAGSMQKATRGGAHTLYSAELETEITQAPGEASQVESKVILNPKVQSCLRAAILKSGDDFSVEFTGQVSAQGKLKEVSVQHDSLQLRECLQGALSRIAFAPDQNGPLQMRISRVRTTPPKSKTFLLDLNHPKKFE